MEYRINEGFFSASCCHTVASVALTWLWTLRQLLSEVWLASVQCLELEIYQVLGSMKFLISCPKARTLAPEPVPRRCQLFYSSWVNVLRNFKNVQDTCPDAKDLQRCFSNLFYALLELGHQAPGYSITGAHTSLVIVSSVLAVALNRTLQSSSVRLRLEI